MHVHAAPAGSKRTSRVLWFSMLATLAYVALTLFAGLRAHSLALLSEAGHNMSDFLALALSFVAVYFPEPGKGQIVFLPKEATLRVLRPSSCLPKGFEVLSENQIYNVFAIDLLARSSLLHKPVENRCHAVAACA